MGDLRQVVLGYAVKYTFPLLVFERSCQRAIAETLPLDDTSRIGIR
jgi:hypothetical protein